MTDHVKYIRVDPRVSDAVQAVAEDTGLSQARIFEVVTAQAFGLPHPLARGVNQAIRAWKKAHS